MFSLRTIQQRNAARLVTLASLLTLVTACFDSGGSSETASGPSAALTLEGPRVVRYPRTRPEIKRELVMGFRGSDGRCGFQQFVRLGKGEAFFQSVAEYDPETCEFILAHHLPASAPPAHGRRPALPAPGRLNHDASSALQSDGSDELSTEAWHPDLQGSPSPPSNVKSAGSVAELCPVEIGNSAGGLQRLWHEDPVGLTVTEHQLDTSFFYHHGECVQYVNSVSRTNWLWQSGWHLETHSLGIFPQNSQWTRVDATAYSSMENPIFCAFNNTFVNYSPNQLRQFTTGTSASGGTSMSGEAARTG